MSTTVNWLWIGNQPQANSNINTPPTTANASQFIGTFATGRSQIAPVALSGVTRAIRVDGRNTDAFATTYNGDRSGASPMSYVSPSNGNQVSTVIAGFYQTRYRLTLPDGSTTEQSGVLIQMRNGDVFMRPALDTLPAWAGITGLQSIEVLSISPYGANVYAATISFQPSIFDLEITCFASGTMIRTPQGDVAVEDLRPGMMVMTRDAGAQPLRWCGASHVPAAVLRAEDRLRPIRIEAGALGAGMPSATLRVSPQHRVLVSSAIAQRMFGTAELLVPAKHLTDLPGVSVDDDLSGVTYHHLMLDAHHILTSNGAPTESLYPGRQALQAIGPDAVAEIETLFPGLLNAAPAPARTLARGHKVRKLAARHAANDHALVG